MVQHIADEEVARLCSGQIVCNVLNCGVLVGLFQFHGQGFSAGLHGDGADVFGFAETEFAGDPSEFGGKLTYLG